MSEKEPKPETASMQVPAEVKDLCESYRNLAELQNKKMTLSGAFSIIYKPAIDVSKIVQASEKLNKIRKDALVENKKVLQELEL